MELIISSKAGLNLEKLYKKFIFVLIEIDKNEKYNCFFLAFCLCKSWLGGLLVAADGD